MTSDLYANVNIFYKQTHEPSPEHPLTISQEFLLNYEGLKIFTDSLVDHKLQDVVIKQLNKVENINKSIIKSIDINITEA